jgi:hypothetical protein
MGRPSHQGKAEQGDRSRSRDVCRAAIRIVSKFRLASLHSPNPGFLWRAHMQHHGLLVWQNLKSANGCDGEKVNQCRDGGQYNFYLRSLHNRLVGLRRLNHGGWRVTLPPVGSGRLLEIENISDQIVSIGVRDYQIGHSIVI